MNIYPQSKIGKGLSLFSFWYDSTYSNILYTYQTKNPESWENDKRFDL